jgi:hypothetical protein
LATSVFAGERLTALVTAAQDFSVVIHERAGTQHGLVSESSGRAGGDFRRQAEPGNPDALGRPHGCFDWTARVWLTERVIPAAWRHSRRREPG